MIKRFFYSNNKFSLNLLNNNNNIKQVNLNCFNNKRISNNKHQQQQQQFVIYKFFSSNSNNNKMNLSEEEWQAKLTPEQFRILRQKGTEAPGTGEYTSHKGVGVYNCAGCDTPLFTSDHKFDSGCGWSSFYDAIPGALTFHEDPSIPGRPRVEICCSKCGGHMGHVFKGEKYNNPIDQRHCVNSVSIKFKPAENK